MPEHIQQLHDAFARAQKAGVEAMVDRSDGLVVRVRRGGKEVQFRLSHTRSGRDGATALNAALDLLDEMGDPHA